MSLSTKLIEGGAEIAEKVVAESALKAGSTTSAKAIGKILLEEVSGSMTPLATRAGAEVGFIAAQIKRTGHVNSLFDADRIALSTSLGMDAAGQFKLDALPQTFHRAALGFIEKDPEKNLDFVRRQIASDTPIEILSNASRMPALSRLEEIVSTETIKALKGLETSNKSILANVNDLIGRQPEAKQFVERLISEGAPADHFTFGRLSAHLKLESTFGEQSDTMKRLLELEKSHGLDIEKADAINHPQLIERLLTRDNAAEVINIIGTNNSPFRHFIPALDANVDALDRATTLYASEGLDIERLHSFIGRIPVPERSALVASQINGGVSVERLNDLSWLPSMHLLSRHLEPDIVDKTVQLSEQSRLQMWRIGSYVNANPAERLDFVNRMVAAKTPDKITEVARLSMFPQATAEELARRAESGEFRVQDVLKHARDLQSGQNFVALTTERIAKNLSLSDTTIKSISMEAAHQPSLLPAFVERKPIMAGEQPAQWYSLENPVQLAKLKTASDIMLDKFAPDRPLVMLARDMDAFTPLLRASGRQTINFPFSRLQIRDPGTQAQWLAEVPPNAVVVDSKLFGSIFDDIARFDPTIEPYLLQSKSKYPELAASGGYDLANAVEYFPKLIGRCSGFRPSGAAICRLSSVDKEDLQAPSLMAIEARESILQDLQLSDWHVWRYKTFTGVPQSERLGITDPGGIKTYLESVARQRYLLTN